MSRWTSGYLLDYEPRGSGSIPEVRNLETCILRIPTDKSQELEIDIEQTCSKCNYHFISSKAISDK